MKTLIIHPNDPSTDMLKNLYSWIPSQDAVVLDEKASNSKVTDEIRSGEYQRIMLLGHGSEYGLFAPFGQNQFGRDIISSRHVQFLREKEVIGIWCNANIFAAKYDLTGLFSGMVISEVSEAVQWNVPTAENEVLTHREEWARSLASHLQENWDDLRRIPDLMSSHEQNTLLEKFNYNSTFYVKNGEFD